MAQAQFEVYELIRLDLWPRYYDEMEVCRGGSQILNYNAEIDICHIWV